MKIEMQSLYIDSDSVKSRYNAAIDSFKSLYGDGEYRLFSAPGRTEIGGNHTDHNNGKVLAASVGLDVIAVVRASNDNIIKVKSEGFDADEVSLSSLEPVESETATSAALIRGIAAGFARRCYKIGGFEAYTTSNVLKGSGLSSSAAFEVLIGTILNHLYNDDCVNPVEVAQISQFAENVYFGKPSGLMDQMASSVGGFVTIDFKDDNNPIIEKIDFDFETSNHALCIIDTKGDHADLTDEYAAIPAEMKSIAGFFDHKVLRAIQRADVTLNVTELRQKYGDRAVMRALHFFDENKRVEHMVQALKTHNFTSFLKNITDSGDSSFRFLQNIYPVTDTAHQGLTLALYITEHILEGRGAARVHGGGFAGTIQAFIPTDMLKQYKVTMESVFGADSCHVLAIRPYGGVEVELD